MPMRCSCSARAPRACPRRSATPTSFAAARAALARRAAADRRPTACRSSPRRRTSSVCSTSRRCWTRRAGSGCIAASTSTRCCSTSRPTGSPSRWRSRRSPWRWPSHPKLEILRPVLAALHHVVRDAGHRRASPTRSRGRTGVSWVTAYGTSELPVIACNAHRRRSAGHRRPRRCRGRLGSCRSRRRAARPGAEARSRCASDSVMAGYLPDSATAAGVLRRLVPHRRRRLPRRRRLAADHRPAKEMIKVRGFQVAPAEIEAVLHGHPAVEDCAVFGVPDAADGEAVIAAVATNAAGRPPTSSSRWSPNGWRPTSDRADVRLRPRNPAAAIGKGRCAEC